MIKNSHSHNICEFVYVISIFGIYYTTYSSTKIVVIYSIACMHDCLKGLLTEYQAGALNMQLTYVISRLCNDLNKHEV